MEGGVKTASREIKKLCKMYQLDFFSLSETKFGNIGIEHLARKLGFNNFVNFPAKEKAGGIALL